MLADVLHSNAYQRRAECLGADRLTCQSSATISAAGSLSEAAPPAQ